KSPAAAVLAQTLHHQGYQLLGDNQIAWAVPKAHRVKFDVKLPGKFQSLVLGERSRARRCLVCWYRHGGHDSMNGRSSPTGAQIACATAYCLLPSSASASRAAASV